MGGEEKSCDEMSKRLIVFYSASKLRRARMRRARMHRARMRRVWNVECGTFSVER